VPKAAVASVTGEQHRIITIIIIIIIVIKYNKNISTELKFVLSWFILPLILFSLFSGKLVFYLLPIYPAAAVLTAYLCRQIIAEQADKRFLVIPVLLTILIITAAYFFIPENIEGYNLKKLLNPTFIFMIVSLLAFLLIYIKKKYSSLVYLLIALMLIFSLNLNFLIVPLASKNYSKKFIAEELKMLREEKNIDNIAAYRFGQPETLAVYTGFFIRDIGNKESLINYLQQNEEAVILISEDDLREIKDIFKQEKEVIYHSNDYNLIYHLVN
jgi:hypothetical protein